MNLKSELVIVSIFVAKLGKADELLQAMQALLEPTRSEDGCLRYELHQSADNPSEFTMIEKFKSKEAAELHIAQPYLKKFIETTLKEIVESYSVRFYHEVV